MAQVGYRKRDFDIRFYFLRRFAISQNEPRAQSGMTAGNFTEAALENADVEIAVQIEGQQHAVEVAAGLKTVEEPQPSLRRREWCRLLRTIGGRRSGGGNFGIYTLFFQKKLEKFPFGFTWGDTLRGVLRICGVFGQHRVHHHATKCGNQAAPAGWTQSFSSGAMRVPCRARNISSIFDEPPKISSISSKSGSVSANRLWRKNFWRYEGPAVPPVPRASGGR